MHPEGMPHAAKIYWNNSTSVFLEFEEDMSCKKFSGPNAKVHSYGLLSSVWTLENYCRQFMVCKRSHYYCFVYEHCLHFIGLVNAGYRNSLRSISLHAFANERNVRGATVVLCSPHTSRSVDI